MRNNAIYNVRLKLLSIFERKNKGNPFGGAAVAWVADAFGAVAFAYGLARAFAALAESPAIGSELVQALFVAMGGAAIRALAAGGAVNAGIATARQEIAAVRRRLGPRLDAFVLAGGAANVDAATLLTDHAEGLEGYLARYQPARGALMLAPILVWAAIAVASPVSGAILAVVTPLLILALILAGLAAKEEGDRQLLALERLSAGFVDRLRALPVILAFQAEAAESQKVAADAQALAERTLAVLKRAFLSSAALEFFSAVSVALVAIYAGFSLLGLLPFGRLEDLPLWKALFVLTLAPEFFLPFRRLAAAYHERQVGEAALKRLAEAPDAQPPPSAPRIATAPIIEFRGVRVIYDETCQIGPISFEAPAGRITALVGPSGIGKTSLLRALLGAVAYDGSIQVDGEPLAPGASLAASSAWAGQHVFILPGDIAANLRLAWPKASMDELAEASRRAGLDEMLARRGGLEARLDERGAGLSGGERRRIGLARAFLKPVPLVLLDEPTSELDAALERDIAERILAFRSERTVILATHSPVLADLADHVVRLT
jgi:ATP-binding cassette subfamily C protein CydD